MAKDKWPFFVSARHTVRRQTWVKGYVNREMGDKLKNGANYMHDNKQMARRGAGWSVGIWCEL